MTPVRQARLGLQVASMMFAAVSIAHLIRLWSDIDFQIGGHQLGFGVSLAAILVSAGLSLWLRKLALGLTREPMSLAPPAEPAEKEYANSTRSSSRADPRDD